MRKPWKVVLITLATVVFGITPASAVPASTTTYNFSGTCTDCSGTATATLVLSNYTLGTPITSSNFVSFTYNGTNLTGPFTITSGSPGLFVSGSINTIPGPNNFSVSVGINTIAAQNRSTVSHAVASNSFFSNTNGNWSVGVIPFDFGTNGVWGAAIAVTPAPPTSVLLVLGLLAVAAFSWRQRRTA
jgi:hypothetical protein